jgi:hypothetical protein
MVTFNDCSLLFSCILIHIIALAVIRRLVLKIQWYKETLASYATVIDSIENLECDHNEMKRLKAQVETYKFEALSYRESFEIAKQSLNKLHIMGEDSGLASKEINVRAE